MNLVHAGGDNTTSNPRVFATFSEEDITFENQNFINNCSICSDHCQTCEMYEEGRETLLKGLEDELHRCGFFICKADSKIPTSLDRFISYSFQWVSVTGLKFKRLGQNERQVHPQESY